MVGIIIAYSVICVVYGFFCAIMQGILYPEKTEWWVKPLSFFINALAMPISIILVIKDKSARPYLKNLYLALKEQGPFKRFFKNFFITRNAWGMFHINSHINQHSGKSKVMYNTKKTAVKSAEAMSKKTGKHFSYYKCAFCNGYHIGKNRDNK